jgi:hypothetical protein
VDVPTTLTVTASLIVAAPAAHGPEAWTRRELIRGGAGVLALVGAGAAFAARSREDLGAGALAAAGLAAIALALDGTLAMALHATGANRGLAATVFTASRAGLPGTAGFAALWSSLTALAPALATGQTFERALALTIAAALLMGQARALAHLPSAPRDPTSPHGLGARIVAGIAAAASLGLGVMPGVPFGVLARTTGSFPAPGPWSLPGWTTWSTVPMLVVATACGLALLFAWWINPRSARPVGRFAVWTGGIERP